ncbi:cytidylate kinase [Snodgrassella communis]|uniref:Cytidylate kinase n=2 Tax=Snodgrassella communis TaxID=2946699 RepID=A0A837AGJ4_9NEIS|nr:(d)CMP kinase [Snodgrassella communis]KDN15266.1 Cytidylate kinase [Snodgrassella communis]PIT10403.1 cytidylate kinase [Snodgrassella communis]PIT26877.1 cytidylate kinase [Snodgrassella communis]PIT29704.1 cytidylate kinase [Snodgrassella communis]PIT34130.1 cytidylate kinase [Snodgrassella communis]
MAVSQSELRMKVIAIDGPSASGKGTVAAQVAAILNRDYLDSGALYRLTALYASQQNIDWHNEHEIATLAYKLPVVFSTDSILLNGMDVTAAIRTETIGMGASAIAALPAVRTALLQRQRDFLTPRGLVADGRDMASVVFPQAELKIFLTASAPIRAQRRALQLGLATDGADYQRILNEIEKRDQADRSRTVAPLKPANDAIILDTSLLSIKESVEKVLDWYRKI